MSREGQKDVVQRRPVDAEIFSAYSDGVETPDGLNEGVRAVITYTKADSGGLVVD